LKIATRRLTIVTQRNSLIISAASVLILLFPASLAAQRVVRSFDGDKGVEFSICHPETTRCGRQPEMGVAADGKHVVQVTWQNVLVFDYKGKLQRSTPTADFVKAANLDPNPPGGKGPFEPHVVFDEFLQRWIITLTCHSDCFLVSATADPMGAWGGVYISCLQGGPCLDRDPALHLGYDKNGVYYCGGHLGDENPHTVPKVAYDCFALPQSEVASIAQGTPPQHLNRAHNLPLDILPAIDHNREKSSNAPEFFVAKTCSRAEPGGCQRSVNFPFEWIVDSFTWNGTSGTFSTGDAEQIVKTDVGSQRDKWLYNLPCCTVNAGIAQAGSDILLRSAESHRLSNLVQFGSHLYGALSSGPCTQDCGPQSEDKNNLLFFVDLDCSKTTACVVSQTEKIAGDFNPEFATVGVDAQGNLGIVAESSTPSTDLSVLLWTHKKSDAANTFAGPVTVARGTQPYTCLNNRNLALLGNAVGVLTALDPRDGTKLWTTQQWSHDATRCVWNTRIVAYQISAKTNVSRIGATKNNLQALANMNATDLVIPRELSNPHWGESDNEPENVPFSRLCGVRMSCSSGDTQ